MGRSPGGKRRRDSAQPREKGAAINQEGHMRYATIGVVLAVAGLLPLAAQVPTARLGGTVQDIYPEAQT
jgi:hypothetical protein